MKGGTGLWGTKALSDLAVYMITNCAPINVTPYLPQVGQKVGICWGLVT